MEVGGMVRQGLSGEVEFEQRTRWSEASCDETWKRWVRNLEPPAWAAAHRGEQAGAGRGRPEQPAGPCSTGSRGLFKMFGFHQQLAEVLRHQRYDVTFSTRGRMWGMGASGRLLHSHSCAWTGKEWSKWDGIRFRTNLVGGCTCWWIGHDKEEERNQSWCLAFGLRK